jgi:hypothetical protein
MFARPFAMDSPEKLTVAEFDSVKLKTRTLLLPEIVN